MKTIVADSFFTRLGGLLFRNLWHDFDALYLKGTRSIHTIGMRQAVDIIAVDKQGKILDCRTIGRGRVYLGSWRTAGILECQHGLIDSSGCEPGDDLLQIKFEGW